MACKQYYMVGICVNHQLEQRIIENNDIIGIKHTQLFDQTIFFYRVEQNTNNSR